MLYFCSNVFFSYYLGSEVKPWTSGANGINVRADFLNLMALVMCPKHFAGWKNSFSAALFYVLWTLHS